MNECKPLFDGTSGGTVTDEDIDTIIAKGDKDTKVGRCRLTLSNPR